MNPNDEPNQGKRGGSVPANGPAPSSTDAERSLILLQELIHLMGLFLIHCRQSKGERATNVLFDQMIRHLAVLQTLPGHDGGVLIRRADCSGAVKSEPPDYMVFFGDLILQGHIDPGAVDTGHHHRTKHQQSALNQTFACLSQQAIHALYLQLPGNSKERIERLRLSMNIISRYHGAAREGNSITFRFRGRTLTIPVIVDARGTPDPNLTLVAALNGLSTVNAKSLIGQAEAFGTLPGTRAVDDDPDDPCASSYNQIFSVRSLRSQIVKPPIEVNNLPWLELSHQATAEGETCRPNFEREPAAGEGEGEIISPSRIISMPGETPAQQSGDRLEPEALSPYVDITAEPHAAAVNMLWTDDYDGLDPLDLGRRLVALTKLLYAIDRKCQDSALIDGILDQLRRRLKRVPDDVLSCMVTKRQGLKINIPGRSIMVGMVHPRLFDLLSLIKEHIVAGQRMAVIRDIAFDFDSCYIDSLADGFGLSTPDAHHLLKVLSNCFGSDGSFEREEFEKSVSAMAQHENAIFEILWCFLKETPRRKDRLDFLNAFQLIMANLNQPKQALQFLLSDICQEPAGFSYTDRNAFALSNILLHAENKELHIDISSTPDDVLAKRRNLNPDVRQYAAWRLEIDQVRFSTKLQSIHQAVQQVVLGSDDQHLGKVEISFLLSLEREALIFAALIGGHTARTLLRQILATYGNPGASVYNQASAQPQIARMIDQLQLVVRCVGRAGHSTDIQLLTALEKKIPDLMDLEAHPAHRLNVKQVAKYARMAHRTIASRGQ